MYGHELIDRMETDLNRGYIDKFHKLKQTDTMILNDIRNSIHFYMGNPIEINEIMWREDYSYKPSFAGELSIKMPYEKICLFFSSSGQKNAILATEKDGGNVIEYSYFGYTPTPEMGGKKYWKVPTLFYKITGLNDGSYNNKVEIVPYPGTESILDIPEDKFVRMIAQLFNFSLAILNTKNIVTIDNPPPPKLNKKRIKNGKQPLFTYKTLRLQLPAKKRKKGSGTSTTTDNTTRLHLCRGHFKTYTADAPLMGKFTGRYWWQPHARGDKTKGVVMKDYEIAVKK